MRKELEVLERIKREAGIPYFSSLYDINMWKEDFETIETTLNEKINIENRLNEIFENHNIKSFTELNERLCDYNVLKFDDVINQKKLKTLKIIKELFDFDFAIRFGDNQPMIKITNKRNGQYWEIPILEEKFDLLKETV